MQEEEETSTIAGSNLTGPGPTCPTAATATAAETIKLNDSQTRYLGGMAVSGLGVGEKRSLLHCTRLLISPSLSVFVTYSQVQLIFLSLSFTPNNYSVITSNKSTKKKGTRERPEKKHVARRGGEKKKICQRVSGITLSPQLTCS